jgi:glycosyltransferase involved in cell wall biosynthesis
VSTLEAVPDIEVPVFSPSGSVGGVEQVARMAHEALSPSSRLHLGARDIARAPRPQVAWMALTWKTHALVTTSHPGLHGPSMLWLHGAELTRDRSPVHGYLRSRALRRSDVLLAVSPLAERLVPVEVQDRLQLVGPPIPTASTATRARPRPHADTSFRLLSVGRAIPRKGHDTAIEVARELSRSGPVRLDLVGPGPGLDALGQQAEEARGPGLDIRVHGALAEADKQQLYAEADLLLFLPRIEAGEYEGLGLVVLEAAAHGCPAVVLDCGGSRYGVADGASGRVLPALSPPAEIAEAARTLLGSPAARDEAARFASRFAYADWQERVRAVAAGAHVEWEWPDSG